MPKRMRGRPHFDGSLMADKLCGVQLSTLPSEMHFYVFFYLPIFFFSSPYQRGAILAKR